MGIDLSNAKTYRKLNFVRRIHERDADEQGFTARSTRAQIKQMLPYMPEGIVDKMLLQAPKLVKASSSGNDMGSSQYCSMLLKK